jgi:arylsulfatase A-like enzyme
MKRIQHTQILNFKSVALSLVALLPSTTIQVQAHYKPSKKQRPNIIYIMTDQQWGKAMSCAGNSQLKTPNIDRLAAKGVRFTQAYCTAPLSGPSRFSMFTGYNPSAYGMMENNTPMPDSLHQKTLGRILTSEGYKCAYAGKWHVHTVSMPEQNPFGFEAIHPHNDYGLAEASIRFLKRKHKKPFFLVVSYDNPHNICEYARGQEMPYASIKEPKLEDCPTLPFNFSPSAYEAAVIPFEKKKNFSLYPTTSYSPDNWRRYVNAYYRLVEGVDKELGKLFDELDKQNLWENTIVIFTSDHGDGVAAHQWNQKSVLYDEVANIPLLVVSPYAKEKGIESQELVSNGIDFMPTILDWAGIKKPKDRDGISFRSLVEHPQKTKSHKTQRLYVVTETKFDRSDTRGWMVRSANYKYVLYDKGCYREQLFDLRKDKGEQVNLVEASNKQSILKKHRAYLKTWMKTHHIRRYERLIK